MGNKIWGGLVEAVPLCSAPLFVSSHSLPQREGYLPPIHSNNTDGVRCILSPSPRFLSNAFFTHNHASARPLSLLLSVSASASFPATPGCNTQAGEGGGGSGVGGLKAGSSESRAKYRHYSNQPCRYGPNRLHILLTPAELQPSDQQQKDKEARKLRALHHSCSVEGATFKFYLFQRQ